MSVRSSYRPKQSRLSAAVFAAILVPSVSAFAQEATTSSADQSSTDSTSAKKSATTLDKVLVTGSLIPQTEKENFQPITVITAEDISARGFTSVSEVLQKSSMATGGVQGGQFSGGFTQGAETVSLFGLPSGYVKYLIDGRPMSNYPALYNGSDTFNNISGIPIDLVDRIEILPGGQSSLYGSDAIAGVINIILKKKLDGPSIDYRVGGYSEGGGTSNRLGIADGFTAFNDRLNVLVGLQHENRDPIWGYQRDLTKQKYQDGATAPTASLDYLIRSVAGGPWYFFDPTNCGNVANQYGGTEGKHNRAGLGDSCGSYTSGGYRTLLNGKDANQGYAHATFDINDNTQVYADVLMSQEKDRFNSGSSFIWWGTSDIGAGYFYDPNLDDLISIQRAIAPEEFGPGGYSNTDSRDTEKSYSVDLGIKGTFGASNWDYDFSLSRTQDTLDETNWVRWADKIDQYFIDHVLGEQHGVDPYGYDAPSYTPDYAALYQPISPEDMAAMTGFVHSHSKTYDEMARAQLTNGSLFSLPGGDAGLAIALEAGKQDWEYNPDPALMDGSVWGLTAVSGGGDRSRYAGTAELRLPVFNPLTITASARYDAFKAAGQTIDKPTWSLGLEYRPIDSLLFRGKYGTAFRAPTLSDLFQGPSGYYSYVDDYYKCGTLGFDPTAPGGDDKCAYGDVEILGSQSGSVKLKPINADVWNAGLVWSPTSKLAITADVYSWNIRDEVTQQSASALLMQEYRCRIGVDDINSALCVNALDQVERDPTTNVVTGIYTPKINISKQTEKSFTGAVNYVLDAGAAGDFSLRASYTQNLSHKYQQYAGDDYIDLLTNPYWSTDPKRRADGSIGWHIGEFTTTLYANWLDRTPNYAAATSSAGYDAPLAGKLGSYTTFNLSLTWNAFKGLDLSLMANNLFNRMPPADHTYPGSSSAPYNDGNFDVYGRAVYAELHYAFGAK